MVRILTDRRRLVLVCTGLAAAGLVLRLLMIGSKCLWADEAYAAGLMNSSLGELIAGSFRGSPHPPLALIAIRISAAMFGTSETGLRIVPALMSALAVIPLYLFTRRKLHSRGALFCGILWVVSPYAISMGQEVWLYGPLTCVGFLFILTADLAWTGNRGALVALVPLGLAGMLMQHLFLLFILAGYGLYLTCPKESRIPIRKVVFAGVLTFLLYLPFIAPAFRQASLRGERAALANVLSGAPYRMVRRIPTVFARLIPGGLTDELWRDIFSSPRRGGFFMLSLAMSAVCLLSFITDRRVGRALRIWGASLLLVPLLMFVNEDPTVRHLSILWIPLGLGIASLTRRVKWSGPVLAVLTAALLFPYYSLDTFPYHRSDYREAASIIAGNREVGQEVLIFGGQNGGLVWDYYYQGPGGRMALGGETPYEVQPVKSELDRLAVLDSVIESGSEVWVVHDVWGGPTGSDLAPNRAVLLHERPSANMEVLLFGR